MPKATDIGKLSDRAQRLMKAGRWDDAIKLFKANGPIVQKDWQLLWDLGWCYFRTDRIRDAEKYLTKAARLAPEAPACNFALGEIYLRKRQYKKAEAALSKALETKEGHVLRISLALAYLAQGKRRQAENMHLENIRISPKESQRYESYAAFLTDVGREAEAKRMNQKAKELRRIN